MDTTKITGLAINNHGFVFDPASGYSYNANGTALLIISLLKEEKSEEEIVKILYDRYDVDKEVLTSDIEFFLSQLNLYGLIDME